MPGHSSQFGALQFGDAQFGSEAVALDQTLTGSAGLSTLSFGSGGFISIDLIAGFIGFDYHAFGAGGVVLRDLPITGLVGLDALGVGVGGSLLYDQTLLGLTGLDTQFFGANGILIEAGVPVNGILGIDFLEFGLSGSLDGSFNLRGARGLRSSLQFGFGGLVSVDYGQLKEYKKPWIVDPSQVTFRPTTTGLYSRHLAAQTVDLADGISFISAWRQVKIPPAPNDRLITVGTGEQGRLDIIALNYYKDSRLWWVIALANDIFNPFEEPLAGDRIRIPAIDRLQSFLGRQSSGQEVFRYRPV